MWWILADSSNVVLVSVVVSISVLTHWLIVALYNIFFHPLAKFPGPPLAAASYIPYALHQVDGSFSVWIKALHEHYKSDVVRVSPKDVSFICTSAWKDISGHRVGHRPYEHDAAVYGKAPNGVDSLLTAKKADHSRLRRVLDHAFSTKALKEQDPLILAYVDSLVGSLYEQVAGPCCGKVDLTQRYGWMIFDLIGSVMGAGDLAFGESFDCLQHEKNHPWVQMVSGNLQGIVFKNALSRFLPVDSILPYLLPRKTQKMINDHWAATQEKLQRRIGKGTSRPDFLTPILENNNGKGLSEGEIESNASLFIIAGSDSITTVLAGVTWYLLKYPKIMQKLREELDQAFQTESDITVQKVEQLPYLVAVLDEAMRIYPVALTGQASIIPPEGDDVAGHWLPGGTGVMMNQYAVYRSATNFTEPDLFAPERWLGDSRFDADKEEAFYPFSMGARGCIGKKIGLAVPLLTLAKMVWHFDIELSAETDPNWVDQKVFLVWQKKPLFVELKTRRKGKGML